MASAGDEKVIPEPPIWQLLGSSDRNWLVNNAGKRVPLDSLKGKIVGVYFSAHWCPPCRQFTPVLADVYRQLLKEGKQFEVVFASSDRDDASFRGYFSEMPWLAVPFGDRNTKANLSERYGNGQLLTDSGREAVGSTGAAGYPWAAYKGKFGAAAGNGFQRIVLLLIVMWMVWSWTNKS